MSEEIITTKRGTYGRVQVTIPMSVKHSMLTWARKSGLGKAEFLRMALMSGAIQLADTLKAKKSDDGYTTESNNNADLPSQDECLIKIITDLPNDRT